MKAKNILFFVAAFFCQFVLAQQRPFIIEKPITWNAEREALSVDYLHSRHQISQKDATIKPQIVVVHWTENNSVAATFTTFNPVLLPGRPELTRASRLNVSSQYVIDRDGTIYQFLPDTMFARHTIGLNYCAIGIENIGGSKNPLTQAQLEANTALIRYLMTKYPIEYVIGHQEYGFFRDTNWWKEADSGYMTSKTDPGLDFMYKLRSILHLPVELKLK